jgi:hypothetical protein
VAADVWAVWNSDSVIVCILLGVGVDWRNAESGVGSRKQNCCRNFRVQ